MFAVGAIRSGLEVGGRWERIGVEEPKSAHELTWNVEIDVVECLDIGRIAQKGEKEKEREREDLESVRIDIQRVSDRSWSGWAWHKWETKKKVDLLTARV